MNLRTVTVLAAVVVALPATAMAEEHKCACCKDKHPSHTTAQPAPSAEPHVHGTTASEAPAYDFEYEGSFSGIVLSVMRHQGMDVQLTLGAGENTFEVLVAPMDWLDQKHVVFRTGDKVNVVGSRQEGAPNAIIAREILTADQTVVVRDANGRALWN